MGVAVADMFEFPEDAPNSCPCLLCCHPTAARLKISTKNRPYVRCSSCSSMTYLNSRAAFNGYTILAPHVARLFAQFTQTRNLEEERANVERAARAQADAVAEGT